MSEAIIEQEDAHQHKHTPIFKHTIRRCTSTEERDHEKLMVPGMNARDGNTSTQEKKKGSIVHLEVRNGVLQLLLFGNHLTEQLMEGVDSQQEPPVSHIPLRKTKKQRKCQR